MDKYLSGNTQIFTWVSSGQSPSPITAAVLDISNTVISSGSMTSSGNGHYYRNVTMPTTEGFYIKETKATISGDVFRDREKFQVILCEVD